MVDKKTSKKSKNVSKPNVNIKDSSHMLNEITDIDEYIKNTKKWSSWRNTSQSRKTTNSDTKNETYLSKNWTDLRSLPNIYAIIPHKKWDHKLVWLKWEQPEDLWDDDKKRARGWVYEKKWIAIYNVIVDFHRHATLLDKSWTHIDVRVIASPDELELQMDAIRTGKGWGVNFWDPILLTSHTSSKKKKWSNEATEKMNDEKKKKRRKKKEEESEKIKNEKDKLIVTETKGDTDTTSKNNEWEKKISSESTSSIRKEDSTKETQGDTSSGSDLEDSDIRSESSWESIKNEIPDEKVETKQSDRDIDELTTSKPDTLPEKGSNSEWFSNWTWDEPPLEIDIEELSIDDSALLSQKDWNPEWLSSWIGDQPPLEINSDELAIDDSALLSQKDWNPEWLSSWIGDEPRLEIDIDELSIDELSIDEPELIPEKDWNIEWLSSWTGDEPNIDINVDELLIDEPKIDIGEHRGEKIKENIAENREIEWNLEKETREEKDSWIDLSDLQINDEKVSNSERSTSTKDFSENIDTVWKTQWSPSNTDYLQEWSMWIDLSDLTTSSTDEFEKKTKDQWIATPATDYSDTDSNISTSSPNNLIDLDDIDLQETKIESGSNTQELWAIKEKENTNNETWKTESSLEKDSLIDLWDIDISNDEIEEEKIIESKKKTDNTNLDRKSEGEGKGEIKKEPTWIDLDDLSKIWDSIQDTPHVTIDSSGWWIDLDDLWFDDGEQRVDDENTSQKNLSQKTENIETEKNNSYESAISSKQWIQDDKKYDIDYEENDEDEYEDDDDDDENEYSSRATRNREKLLLWVKVLALLTLLWIWFLFYRLMFSNTWSGEIEDTSGPTIINDSSKKEQWEKTVLDIIDEGTTVPPKQEEGSKTKETGGGEENERSDDAKLIDDLWKILDDEWSEAIDNTNSLWDWDIQKNNDWANNQVITKPTTPKSNKVEPWNTIWEQEERDESTPENQEYRKKLIEKLSAQKRETRTLLNKARLINNVDALKFAVAWFKRAEDTIELIEAVPEEVTLDVLERNTNRIDLYIKSVRNLLD